MENIEGTKTLDNLKMVFAGEAQASIRYLYFARKADLDGYPEVASVFREVAEGETGHAFGNIEYTDEKDPMFPNTSSGETRKNLTYAMTNESNDFIQLYPGFAKIAREEGLDEIAEWFEVLAKSEKAHSVRFQKVLNSI
jgi:rubrerythrin